MCAIYLVVAKLGLVWASVHPNATPIWPPTGLALAACLLLGYRIWPAIFIGAFVANATTAGSIYTSSAIAAGNTLESLVGSWLLSRWSNGPYTFETPAGVTKFAAISLLSTLISATIGVGSLSIAGFADWHRFPSIWMTWCLGDLAGALVVTPAVVLWAPRMSRAAVEWRPASLPAAIFGLTALVGLLAFSPLLPQSPHRGAMGFLVVVPLLWAALRGARRETATVALLISAFAVWGTAFQAGPFARADLNESFLLLLAFIISVSLPSLALSADVATRKAHEAHLNEVLRELSHRSKNLLSVVQSVAREVGRHTGDFKDFEPAFGARLAAFAETHDLLVAGRWGGVKISDLICSQTAPFAVQTARFVVKGPELVLAPKTAEQIGWAIHELATNAAKYGALSTLNGMVHIAWETEAGVLRLLWSERDGPPVAVPSRHGFGHLVLTQIVPRALQAQASLDFRPEGVTWQLVAPIANVAAQN